MRHPPGEEPHGRTHRRCGESDRTWIVQHGVPPRPGQLLVAQRELDRISQLDRRDGRRGALQRVLERGLHPDGMPARGAMREMRLDLGALVGVELAVHVGGHERLNLAAIQHR